MSTVQIKPLNQHSFDHFDIRAITEYCYYTCIFQPFRHEINIININKSWFIVLFTYCSYMLHLVVFPLVPIERIPVVCRKRTIGTSKGFSCVYSPDVSITTILGNCDGLTLWAGVINFPPNPYQNRFLIVSLLFNFLRGWALNIHRCRWWCCQWSLGWRCCQYRWWSCRRGCSHGPDRPQQLRQVPCTSLIHSFFEHAPTIRNHTVSCSHSPNSWNGCIIF